MKSCPNCGQELKLGDKYCASCGHEVTSETKEVTPPKRSFKQKLLIVLGGILTFIGLFLFPIIGPLSLIYAAGTLILVVLGIFLLVIGLKKPKNPK